MSANELTAVTAVSADQSIKRVLAKESKDEAIFDDENFTSATSLAAPVHGSFFGRIKEAISGIYGLGVIAVTLILHADEGWLAAMGHGLLWPLTLGLRLYYGYFGPMFRW